MNKLKLDFVINLADAAAFDFMPDILSNCWIFFFLTNSFSIFKF